MLTAPAVADGSLLFAPFDLSSRNSVIAAVSGGSDSTALLFLLKAYLDRFAPGTRLVAATVDHRLRAGSANEAAGVASFCAQLGVDHLILDWTGPKPATGVPAAAREARYRLLAEAADSAGTDIVLTGHTADDQAETVLMRQSRDPGRGLAGIAPATLFDSRLWILRPLLAVRRAALREVLLRSGQSWMDDPTNDDAAFERPRIRSMLGENPAQFDAAISTAAEAAVKRRALGVAAARLVERHATSPALGLIRLDPDLLRADSDAAIYALRILLAVAGGVSHLPDEARAAALFARLGGRMRGRAVLSRTLIDQRRSGIFLLREARDVPPVTIAPEAIWDGRYRLAAPLPERSGGRVSGQADAPASLVGAASATLPASKLAGVTPVLAPWSRFLPGFDLAPARAVAALVGAPDVPVSPFRRHIDDEA